MAPFDHVLGPFSPIAQDAERKAMDWLDSIRHDAMAPTAGTFAATERLHSRSSPSWCAWLPI